MSNKKYPSQELDRYIVKFPDGMRDELKAAAKSNNRSLNAEIIARLEAYPALLKQIEDLKNIDNSKEIQKLVDERVKFIFSNLTNMKISFPTVDKNNKTNEAILEIKDLKFNEIKKTPKDKK